MKAHFRSLPKQQNGVALVVSLILLIVITLLGLSSIRTIVLEEKMASNTYDRSLAFQAAEAGLRAGEAIAEAQSKLGNPNQGFPAYTDADNSCPANAINACNAGLCATPDKDCPARWSGTTAPATFNWDNSAAPAGGLNLNANAGAAPRYFVEYLGNQFPCDPDDANACSGGAGAIGCNSMRYRVTARSQPSGNNDRATVMLQTIYAPL